MGVKDGNPVFANCAGKNGKLWSLQEVSKQMPSYYSGYFKSMPDELLEDLKLLEGKWPTKF